MSGAWERARSRWSWGICGKGDNDFLSAAAFSGAEEPRGWKAGEENDSLAIAEGARAGARWCGRAPGSGRAPRLHLVARFMAAAPSAWGEKGGP